MLEFMIAHQNNIMLAIASICGIIALFTAVSRAITKRRRISLLLISLFAMTLLISERHAYEFSGDPSVHAYYMVRLFNFLEFTMTVLVVAAFNNYIKVICITEVGHVPKRIRFVEITSLIAIGLIIVSQFTGLYYTFDANNVYMRSQFYFISYIFPLLNPIVDFTVVVQYYKRLRKGVRFSLILFIIVPIAASILQFFVYGMSLTSISLVGMVVVVYIFDLVDMNITAEKNAIEERRLLREARMGKKHLLEQATQAFIAAINLKDDNTKGHSERVAITSQKIAEILGKTDEECEKIFYTALLHEVGRLGIPDSILNNDGELTDEEYAIMKTKPVIGNEILSYITEYPFLKEAAHYSHERFDGKGYPNGLFGKDIPEAARIVAVADAYDTMNSKTSFRAALPIPIIREELIKESGMKFDPDIVKIVLDILEADAKHKAKANERIEDSIEKKLHIGKYRSAISTGIPISEEMIKISFKSQNSKDAVEGFSMPSIIVYDSYDGNVHNNEKTIKVYHYVEYGEAWFDGHIVSTSARGINTKISENTFEMAEDRYEILAARISDHIKIEMKSKNEIFELIVAIPEGSENAFISLTGEYCDITEIKIEKTGQKIQEDEIERIAEKISYTNRMVSDLPNIQVEQSGSAYTEGFLLKDTIRLAFHSQSLPKANFVWQCPHIVIYSSYDGKVGGAGYDEYARIKLNGEDVKESGLADNNFYMKKTEEFENWNVWKEENHAGREYTATFRRKGNKIQFNAENGGILIQNVTNLKETKENVFAAITGEQCAITDIRIY
ncbi:MAG: HD domain-containing protein [Parasporobacterium sp.]|nr:HD domain-containing protein [Parasporobacterium sp.]